MAATEPPLVTTTFGHACPPAEGHPDKHAITIHMPKWQSVLDFVESKPEIFAAIKSIYPRMMPIIQAKELTDHITKTQAKEGEACFLFPIKFAAEANKHFATHKQRKEAPIPEEKVSLRAFQIGEQMIFGIFFPAEKKPAAIGYWQNAGVGISSRFAETALANLESLKEVPWETAEAQSQESPDREAIRERIVSLLERSPLEKPTAPLQTSDVYLYQNGQAAIYHIHRYLESSRPGTTILFGFAFHSTPHTLEDFISTRYKFFGLGTEYNELESFLKDGKTNNRPIQAIWAEFPSNPFLVTQDLKRLRDLADEYACPLIIDDTISSFCNVDLLGPSGADILITSLTKSFSGYADVMGGSAVLNPSRETYKTIKDLCDAKYTNDLFHGDAAVLLGNSADYLERSKILNHNALTLVNYLSSQSSLPDSPIARIWYPTTSDTLTLYDARLRPSTPDFPSPGYGCLFSVELRTPAATQAFYDCLGDYCHVGPHLGAHRTLVLAYNKAIYAKELESVAQWGVNERQIRVSVGLEETGVLVKIFELAVEKAKAGVEREKEVPTVAGLT